MELILVRTDKVKPPLLIGCWHAVGEPHVELAINLSTQWHE